MTREEKIDALLDEAERIAMEHDATPRWRLLRRAQLRNDQLTVAGRIQQIEYDEAVRRLRDGYEQVTRNWRDYVRDDRPPS